MLDYRTALRKALLTDRFLQALLFLYTGIALIYVVPSWRASQGAAASFFWDGFLLILAILAIQTGLQRAHEDSGLRFWNTVTAALTFWFLADLVRILPIVLGGGVWYIDFITDSLYSVYYIVLVLASREAADREHERIRMTGPRIWSSIFFVLAFLVYFSWIPAWKAPLIFDLEMTGRNSLLFYVCMDLYVGTRFALLAATSRKAKWRLVYYLLFAALIVSALLNGLQIYSPTFEAPTFYAGSVWDLLWYTPFLFISLAARLERCVDESQEAKEGLWRDDAPDWEPIAFYAVTFPLVHLLLDINGWVEPSTRDVRQTAVVVYFVLFGALALKHSWTREKARLESERRLRASQGQLQTVVENIPEIILIESDKKLIYANSNAVKKLGDERLLHGAAYAFDLEDWLLQESNHVPVFKRLNETPGENLDLEITWSRIEYQGKPALQVHARDVTVVQRMHREAEKLERLAEIGRFSSAMAHRIRNPLAVIVMQASYLGKKLEDEPEYLEVLDDLQISADRLRRLVNSVQNFVKEPKAQIRTEQVEDVVKSAWSSLEYGVPNIELKESYEHVDGAVDVDFMMMRDALGHLFSNAVRAMPGGGTLTIKTENVEDDSLEILIEDTGDGISEPDLQRIYEPFFSRRDDGVGLGLSFVEKILNRHGAQILIESELGVGTKAKVLLKRASMNHPAHQPPGSPQ